MERDGEKKKITAGAEDGEDDEDDEDSLRRMEGTKGADQSLRTLPAACFRASRRENVSKGADE